MSGRVRGVQQLIRTMSENPCPYVHCHAHRLNLVLVDVSKGVDGVGEMFGLLEAIYAFQSVSTIRNAIFKDVQETIYIGERILKIPQQSDTRWVCKYVGVSYFYKRFASVVRALTDLSKSSNRKEAAEARGLLIQFNTFDVVFYLNMFHVLLGITNGLSQSLQTVSIDIGTCRRLLDGVVRSLHDKRTDEAFNIAWNASVKYALENNIHVTDNSEQESRRPVCLSAALANSVVMSSVGQRERDTSICRKAMFRARYFEILDSTTEELIRRFTESDDVLNALCAFDPRSACLLSVELLREIANKYASLLQLNMDLLEAQILVARNMFLNARPSTTLQMYEQLQSMQGAFPDLLVLFKVALTVPVASASAERSFSAMRRIKNHLRSSMSASRTSDLSLVAVERELSDSILKDPTSVVDAFAAMGKRRLNLK